MTYPYINNLFIMMKRDGSVPSTVLQFLKDHVQINQVEQLLSEGRQMLNYYHIYIISVQGIECFFFSSWTSAARSRLNQDISFINQNEYDNRGCITDYADLPTDYSPTLHTQASA